MFADNFSIGPIWNLHEEPGLSNRNYWLKNHLLFEEDEWEQQAKYMREVHSKLNTISEKIPIYIWTCDNAHEQIGLRMALFLLKEKKTQFIA
ncbi:DUF1835 domain-containing protein [Niallia nealsonii]|uniref:DUF1835 domain-containing protein n=1 Tax=Niallia nealsonii TaxID=115979 RepID=UPI0012FF2609|nr:DUF1835 domain-containing protein [Niallia nealsonii]